MTLKIDRQIKMVSFLLLIYLLVSIPVYFIEKSFVHIMMVWNVFLAILPFYFAKLLSTQGNGKKTHMRQKIIIVGLLWLVFFPNAPYMITDFIHTSGIVFYYKNSAGHGVYSTNIVYWLKLLHIGFGVVFGTVSGLASLEMLHRFVSKKKGKLFGGSFVALISLLSGYAVYVGRFLRFNTWDIIRPLYLIKQTIVNTNLFALEFSALFAVYILATYILFIFFRRRNG